jgi:hypothetical protein
MVLALSTPARIATGVAILCLILLVRGFGRWLIQKGSSIEAARHGTPPGSGSAKDRPEPERYDPFNAG